MYQTTRLNNVQPTSYFVFVGPGRFKLTARGSTVKDLTICRLYPGLDFQHNEATVRQPVQPTATTQQGYFVQEL